MRYELRKLTTQIRLTLNFQTRFRLNIKVTNLILIAKNERSEKETKLEIQSILLS